MTYMGYLLGPMENLVQKITTRYQKVIDVSRIYDVLKDHEGIENLRKTVGFQRQLAGKYTLKTLATAIKTSLFLTI